jgi:hypothetical protein
MGWHWDQMAKLECDVPEVSTIHLNAYDYTLLGILPTMACMGHILKSCSLSGDETPVSLFSACQEWLRVQGM